MAFDADGPAPPVHEKINGQKVAGFLHLDYCLLVFQLLGLVTFWESVMLLGQL